MQPGQQEQFQVAKIFNHSVYYQKNAKNGVEYLQYDLDGRESSVFFDQARIKGRADFEDDREGQFTLDYRNGKYFLIKR
ncbi:hypothetical protein ACFL14_01510 [Patescibacteria group bacterium]